MARVSGGDLDHQVPLRRLSTTDTLTGLHSRRFLDERLRRDVEECSVDGLKVTISLGVATVPDILAGASEDLVAAADSALYRAKAGGRNRVEVAQAAGNGATTGC